MFQLIIIRGNSGSGKSTVAQSLRTRLTCKTALIEQDYFRRMILKEKDEEQNKDILELLLQTVRLAVSKNYTVILEGILHAAKY
ncbi:MAG: AAA family ATPase [Pseudomonadota bacterium]